MTSWVQYDAATCPFPIQNLPYGVANINGTHCAVSAIGSSLINLKELASRNFFEADVAAALQQPTLNAFMALGHDRWTTVRKTLTKLFSADDATIRDDATVRAAVLVDPSAAKMVLPATIGDYTDFYASKEHATNLGKMFRPGQPSLMENWLHIPVGYHGRASSVIVSGTDVRRPNGQKRPNPEAPPVFGPSMALDFELEMATWIGQGNAPGEVITVDDARKSVFGFSLFNDWSARDIQKWEYVPLGPFLGKNFASTISPWIITTDALVPFLCAGPKQDPAPLPYLTTALPGNYDVKLAVEITTKEGETHTVSTTSWKYMYWSTYQQLCHHSINGCNMRPGDLIASGTISGPEPGTYGSMIELAWQGTQPIKFPSGAERKMIQDGDTVTMKGYCQGEGYIIGFGEASGKIVPALDLKF